MTADIAKQLLTTREVSALTGIAYDTLCQWRLKGQGPRSIKAGRRAVRYRRADVEVWMASGDKA